MPLLSKSCRLVDQLESLAPSVPSLIACTSLTVKGPVRFEGGVAIRGDVTLTNGGFKSSNKLCHVGTTVTSCFSGHLLRACVGRHAGTHRRMELTAHNTAIRLLLIASLAAEGTGQPAAAMVAMLGT